MKKIQLPTDPIELAAFLMSKRDKATQVAKEWNNAHRELCNIRSKTWRKNKKMLEKEKEEKN